jgi:hypothetical protein
MMPISESDAAHIVTEHSCPQCAELWERYANASRKYVELLEEQVAAAITDPERAWLLDPLIQVAVKRRNSARSDVETHRVVDHGKVHRMPTLLRN